MVNAPRAKKLPASDRPRERLCTHGAEVLSDRELLALILRSGRRGVSALDLATELACVPRGPAAARSPEDHGFALAATSAWNRITYAVVHRFRARASWLLASQYRFRRHDNSPVGSWFGSSKSHYDWPNTTKRSVSGR